MGNTLSILGLNLAQTLHNKQNTVMNNNLTNKTIIRSVNSDQHSIIKDIMTLYIPQGFDVDITYSKGNFYKNGVPQPKLKFDIEPQTEDTIRADAKSLPLMDSSVNSIMFDPPFAVGYTKSNPSGIIGGRFSGFPYITDLWKWYDEVLAECYRVLTIGGYMVIKCQDTVSSGRNHFSHVHIMNRVQELGMKNVDLFILTAANRIIGHNHHVQKHARKFHSYFIVVKK